MKHRVEIIGDARLILGDCREVLETIGAVDAIVTDPPYGIDYGLAGGFSASHGWGQCRENVAWDAERPAKEIFDAMRACSKHQIIWGGNYFTDLLPPTMQWLVWDKGQRDFSLADCEFAWSSQNKAARIMNYGRGKARLDGKEHPTQKPVQVMQWCLGFVPDSQIICDPFMGAGTTGVAAMALQRKFIGIEIDETYFDVACRRIAEAWSQPRLFAEPIAKPVQPSMFD